jgi:hypothetical protein
MVRVLQVTANLKEAINKTEVLTHRIENRRSQI